jgi:hypothetical protein
VTTIRPRVVRALRDARTRMRDVAAAAHSTASAERDVAARALEDEQALLEAALDSAAGSLAGARSVYEIDQVAEGTGVHRFAVADATERHVEATAVTVATADQLRGRTRQLRTAERLVDLVDEHRSKHEARDEQRSSDDMAARRR